LFELLVGWVVEPITVPVCDGGVGVGVGGCVGIGCGVGCHVGCDVGDGCGTFVGEGFAVGDLEGVDVVCIPFADPVVGVFPEGVAAEVDPVAGTLGICDGDRFML
jgi:hypothetical protein